MRDIAKDIFNKYGPLLSTSDLAEIFKYKNARSVSEAIHRESFPSIENPLPTKRNGKFLIATYLDVTIYLEKHFIQSLPPDIADKDACNASD